MGEETFASAAFDRQSGRVVHVDSTGETWTFDVCTNTWKLVPTNGAGPSQGSYLFYDAVDDLTYAVNEDRSFPSIRTYDVETSTWTPVAPRSAPLWEGLDPRFVMDPTNRVIYGYQPSTGQLRAYDIAGNTWTELEQRKPRPPTGVDGLASFDPTVGRIVLYIGLQAMGPLDPASGEPLDPAAGPIYSQTWTFDPGTGTWRQAVDTAPIFNFGWFMAGTEITYDEASRRTVVFSDGSLSALDGTTMTWSTPQPTSGWPPQTPMPEDSRTIPQPDGTSQVISLAIGPLARLNHGLVDDVMNGRVLVFGGRVRTGVPDDVRWRDGTDVWAYDVAANTWTELVPQQPS